MTGTIIFKTADKDLFSLYTSLFICPLPLDSFIKRSFCLGCCAAGSITLDLNRIPKPAKGHKNCTLKMLRTDGKVPTLNLLKNKRCKGWWPVAAREKDEETGEEDFILKVCCCCCC